MKNSFFVPKILWHFSVDDLFKKRTLGLDKILRFYSNCLIYLLPWKIFGESLVLIKITFVYNKIKLHFTKWLTTQHLGPWSGLIGQFYSLCSPVPFDWKINMRVITLSYVEEEEQKLKTLIKKTFHVWLLAFCHIPVFMSTYITKEV